MLNEVSPVQPANAKDPTDVREDEDGVVKVTFVRLVQDPKACAPMVTTLVGMVTVFRPEAKNALDEIIVTVVGIFTDVNAVQPENNFEIIVPIPVKSR